MFKFNSQYKLITISLVMVDCHFSHCNKLRKKKKKLHRPLDLILRTPGHN